MAKTREVWEHGSDAHWPAPQGVLGPTPPWDQIGRRLGSGRDALRFILRHGRAVEGWRLLWVPSYYCQEVLACIGSEIELALYEDSPFEHACVGLPRCPGKGEAVLWVNYFGLRRRRSALGGVWSRKEVVVIEDHSHDPTSSLAYEGQAQWAIASLRKTMPLPDGGVVWSPRGVRLPSAPGVTAAHEAGSLQKFAGMVLKGAYLAGAAVRKVVYRSLLCQGESTMAGDGVSGMTALSEELEKHVPLSFLRSVRRRNYSVFARELQGVPWLTVLHPERGACPFGCVVLFDSEKRRERIRVRLIEEHAYPAVLWSLERPVLRGIPARHIDYSRRVLVFHCDWRYTPRDMSRVARLIREHGAMRDVIRQ